MTDKTKDESLYKASVKIGLKTILSCFIVLMFFTMSTFFIFPNLNLKINKLFGLNKLQEKQYERIYDKSGNLTDLYNLILCEQRLCDYENELKSINEMMSRIDYDEFCQAVDNAGFEEVSDKELIPYLCDVDAFLSNQKVICKYKLEKTKSNGTCGESLGLFLLRKMDDGKITNNSFSTYINLINNDKNLTNSQKIELIEDVWKSWIINEQNTMSKLVLDRIDELKTQINLEQDEYKKILMQYSLMNNYGAVYIVSAYLNENENKTKYEGLYHSARETYNLMIG